MEDKKITEQESLELISQMIKQTQKKVADKSGMPFVIWGVIMMIVAIVVGLGIQITGNGAWMWGYFAIPVLGYVCAYIHKRKSKENDSSRTKTFIENALDLIWRGIGVVLLAYPLIIFVLRTHEPKAWIGMYFLGVFMPMIGSYLTSLMLKMKKLTFYLGLPMGMSLMLLSDLLTDNVMTNNYNYYFAFCAFLSMVVPGIIINKEAKKSLSTPK